MKIFNDKIISTYLVEFFMGLACFFAACNVRSYNNSQEDRNISTVQAIVCQGTNVNLIAFRNLNKEICWYKRTEIETVVKKRLIFPNITKKHKTYEHTGPEKFIRLNFYKQYIKANEKDLEDPNVLNLLKKSCAFSKSQILTLTQPLYLYNLSNEDEFMNKTTLVSEISHKAVEPLSNGSFQITGLFFNPDRPEFNAQTNISMQQKRNILNNLRRKFMNGLIIIGENQYASFNRQEVAHTAHMADETTTFMLIHTVPLVAHLSATISANNIVERSHPYIKANKDKVIEVLNTQLLEAMESATSEIKDIPLPELAAYILQKRLREIDDDQYKDQQICPDDPWDLRS